MRKSRSVAAEVACEGREVGSGSRNRVVAAICAGKRHARTGAEMSGKSGTRDELTCQTVPAPCLIGVYAPS